jgi:hypothetical protein
MSAPAEHHDPSTERPDDAAVRIALAAHAEFVAAFIEGRGWCPFARASRQQGRSTTEALTVQPGPDDPLGAWDPLHDLLRAFADAPDAEVLQVVFPCLQPSARAWDQTGRRLVDAFHADRGGRSVLAIAAFHPELPVHYPTAPGIVPLLRRSPLPAFQFVRLDALTRVKKGRESADRFVMPGTPEFHALLAEPPREPIGDVILRTNFADVSADGVAAVEARLQTLAEAAALHLQTARVTRRVW